MTATPNRTPRRQRRTRRSRIQLITMPWEDLFPLVFFAILVFVAVLGFLKTTAHSWPSWDEMWQSLVNGAWVGIAVVLVLGTVAAIAWMKDR